MYNKINIGNYLRELINNKYDSHARTKFCKEWLIANKEDANDPSNIESKKKALSKIINGNQNIQIEDLPVFSEILDVPIAEILSAGEFEQSCSTRLTNRIVALSHDKNIWEEYLANEEKPFLFRDEFGKSIIDYALAYSNYELLKFIINKKIIIFVQEPDTSKERSIDNEFHVTVETNKDLWQYSKSTYRDPQFTDYSVKIRKEIIRLAIENHDVTALRTLNANTPYFITGHEWQHYLYYSSSRSFSKNEEIINEENTCRNLYYDSEMIRLITETNCKDIIAYFTEYLKIEREHDFILFPFYEEIIEGLINNKNYPIATSAINTLIAHYKAIYEKLLSGFHNILRSYLKSIKSDFEMEKLQYNKEYTREDMKKELIKQINHNFKRYESYNSVTHSPLIQAKFFNVFEIHQPLGAMMPSLNASLIKITAKCDDSNLNTLIIESNSLYERICEFSNLANAEKLIDDFFNRPKKERGANHDR